jgi:glycosyltransferase involved in cell wall biosynthesis
MKEYNFFEYENNFSRFEHIKSVRVYGAHFTQKPMVSVTIPTYRRPALLKESIASALNQKNFADYEIVIVDNDNHGIYTEEILQHLVRLNDHRIIYYLNQKNIGGFGNWNRCIELAHGEWMTIY